MKAIITVLGKDKIGLIAKVCNCLADNSCNILDISQTIVKDYLNMMMIVEIIGGDMTFEKVSSTLENLGEEIGMSIKVQSEDIFDSMHRI